MLHSLRRHRLPQDFKSLCPARVTDVSYTHVRYCNPDV
jgi:hypothetical protein